MHTVLVQIHIILMISNLHVNAFILIFSWSAPSEVSKAAWNIPSPPAATGSPVIGQKQPASTNHKPPILVKVNENGADNSTPTNPNFQEIMSREAFEMKERLRHANKPLMEVQVRP